MGFLAALLFLLQDPPDVVDLQNGDRITGTIVGAAGGKLTIKTDYAEAVVVEMAKVKSITTGKPLAIHTAAGDVATVHWDRVADINPPPKPDATYKGSVALGASYQGGNVNRLAATLAAEAERRTDDDRLSFRFLWNYAEEDNRRTSRNVFAGLKYDYFLSDDLYGYLLEELYSDEFKDLSLRSSSGLGLGLQVIEEKDMGLLFEAGYSYVSNNHDDAKDEQFGAIRLAAKFDWTISGTIAFSDLLVYYPSLEDGEYTARNEASITNAMGGGWALKISNILDYDSEPAAKTVERLDSLWLISLQYTFG